MKRKAVRFTDAERNEIWDRIEAGEWLPGEQIPSVRQIAAQYEVSIGTARRALVVLRDEGLIVVTPSWGAFIPQ